MCNRIQFSLFVLFSGWLAAFGPGTSRGAAPDAPTSWKIGTPIVTYWAGPAMTDATAAQMAAGGWNLVWCQESELDVAQRHGLRGMLVAARSHQARHPGQSGKAPATGCVARAGRKTPGLVLLLHHRRARCVGVSRSGKARRASRARDPAHMAYINLFPTYASNEQLGTRGDAVGAYAEHLRQFVQTVKPELISYDHYQFAADGDLDGYFLNLAMIREAAQTAGVPFLNIVQACSWTPVRRVPKGDEMRYLLYTSLAYGAQGISYYVYCCAGHTGGIANADGTPTALYDALRSLNREFVAVADELASLKSVGAYHLGMLPAGAIPLPQEAPFRLDPPLPEMPYQNLQARARRVAGTFRRPIGTSPRDPRAGGQPRLRAALGDVAGCRRPHRVVRRDEQNLVRRGPRARRTAPAARRGTTTPRRHGRALGGAVPSDPFFFPSSLTQIPPRTQGGLGCFPSSTSFRRLNFIKRPFQSPPELLVVVHISETQLPMKSRRLARRIVRLPATQGRLSPTPNPAGSHGG